VGSNLSLGCFYLSKVDVFVERRGREKKRGTTSNWNPSLLKPLGFLKKFFG
jgi:hypothetical protein